MKIQHDNKISLFSLSLQWNKVVPLILESNIFE